MSYCKFCGSKLEDNALFCPGCGAGRAEATEGLPAVPERAPEAVVSEPPRGMNGFAIAGFAAAFSVPLAGLILSIIANVRAKSGEYKSPMRSLAVSGIIVSIVMMVLTVLFIIAYLGFMNLMLQKIFELVENSNAVM